MLDGNRSIKELVMEAATLTSGGRASCAECTHNYCCVGQKDIEIGESEFHEIEKLITPEQEKRAIKQVKRFDDITNVEKLFDCPFNDPATGMCEIYEHRPYVCAAYLVFNPKEDCNSDTEKGLEVLNPVAVMQLMNREPKYRKVMIHLGEISQSRPMNMIESWREYLIKKELI